MKRLWLCGGDEEGILKIILENIDKDVHTPPTGARILQVINAASHRQLFLEDKRLQTFGFRGGTG